MSEFIGPGIERNSKSTVGFNSDVVNTPDDFEEALETPMSSPRVSYEPVLGTILNTISYDTDVMDNIHIAGGVIEDSTGVVFKSIWDSNTTGKWSSLVNLLHHVLFTRDWTVLVNLVDKIGVWNEAGFTWVAVSAESHVGARNTIVATTGSVDSAGLISAVILIPVSVTIDSKSTVATIIGFITCHVVSTGNKNLWGDIDLWPSSVSSDLYSVRERGTGSLGPAGSAVRWNVLLPDNGQEIGSIDVIP